MAAIALVRGLDNGKWAPLFFVRNSQNIVQMSPKNKNQNYDLSDNFRQLGYELDFVMSHQILADLFHTWICSDHVEGTDSKYRAEVVRTVNVLNEMITLSKSREVNHA